MLPRYRGKHYVPGIQENVPTGAWKIYLHFQVSIS